MASQEGGSMTGLSSAEAREFHRIFMKSAILFTGWAFAAHVLVHLWRPWLYYDGGQSVSSLLEPLTRLPFIG